MVLTFNIVVLGAESVGKSSYITRLATGDYPGRPSTSPTTITFRTKEIGDIQFNVYENQPEHLVKPDGVILMFDYTNLASFGRLGEFYAIYKHPLTVLCGNKADKIKESPLTQTEVSEYYHTTKQYYGCFAISAKSCYNFDKPFLVLAQKLTGRRVTFH